MKRRKFLVSLLLALLMLPLHVFAEEPTYAFTDAEVLARGQLYYSSLNQFFSNVANDNGNAAEVTLTGAIGYYIWSLSLYRVCCDRPERPQ